MAKQMDEGEFDFLIVAEGSLIGDDPTLPGQRTGYSSIKETIEFFRGHGNPTVGTVQRRNQNARSTHPGEG